MNSMIFDVDGTICPIKQENENYSDLIPYKEMIEKMHELKEKGFKIILNTSRNMRTYEGDINKILENTKPVLEEWLKKWDIPYDEVIYGKPWPGKEGFYVDDRAIRPNELINMNLTELKEKCNNDRLDNKAYQYIFKINNVGIKIQSNKKQIIEDLIKKYGDYFEQGTKYDICINYEVDSTCKDGFQFKENEQSKYCYIKKQNNLLNICMEQYDKEDENFVKRMFTTTLIKILQQSGYVIVHGSCVVKDNSAIIISGDKRAGKTTTLLNLVNRGYDYLANDRLALKQTDDCVIVIGIPFSMGIMLEDAKRLFNIDNLSTGLDNKEKKVYLENNQISSFLNVRVKSSAMVKSFILLSYDQSVNSLETKKIDSLIDRLGNNIMTYNSIPNGKFFLNDMFKTNYPDPHFLNDISSFEVKQSCMTFDELDNFIKKEIIKEKQYVLRSTYSYDKI